MKKLFSIIAAVILSVSLYSQISYQAVIRDVNNKLVTNQSIGMRVSIIVHWGPTPHVLYQETYSPNPTTNTNGLVTLAIGSGTPVTGTFSGINWTFGSYSIQAETDPTGGTNYTITATSQVLSVPFAIHAQTADSVKYSNLIGMPVLSTVAKSGSYTDLLNKPALVDSVNNVTINSNQTITGKKTFNNELIINGNVGIGIATPAASAALEISSTNKGFLPPRLTLSQIEAITPVEGLIVYNTTTHKPNYYDGKNWINLDGTPSIGYSYQGGIVAYILQPGDPGYIAGQTHGLIAAPSDQSTGIHWWNGNYVTTGATGTALGTGLANTNIIANVQGAGSYAANLCKNLVLGGYSDWHLPSKDELNMLYLNKTAIGGFVNGFYWSSSEQGNGGAWAQSFTATDYGLQDFFDTNVLQNVRAVRAF